MVEIDGGYHNATGALDLEREVYLRRLGWDVIRFSDKEVEDDAEAVAIQIAKHLDLEYQVKIRKKTGAGIEHVNAPGKPGAKRQGEQSPPRALEPDPPAPREGGG